MSKTPKVDWYVLRGFKLENEDDTGFLGINIPRTNNDTYKIVKSQTEALKFPSENVYEVKGFGTPKQWLEFFKGEDELSGWKFHLLKIRAPEVIKPKKM